MTFPPRIFTFYSYKGGVGRSMALLNVAYDLQARGRHVLMVDMDLEAPGISGYLDRNGELLPATAAKGDVLDVLAQVSARARSGEGAPDLALGDYLTPVHPEKLLPPVHRHAPRARLDLLAADETRDYSARLSALDLAPLSTGQLALASKHFRALLLRHRFPFQQPWQGDDEPPELTGYDYVLIDSRTGLTPIGDFCVGPLADRLVVLCSLNDQNITGTRRFLSSLGVRPAPHTQPFLPWDSADPALSDPARPASLGPRPTLLVATPVPTGDLTALRQRLESMEGSLGLSPLKLSYHSQMALLETLFIRDHADQYLAQEYRRLAQHLMGSVGDTAKQWVAQLAMVEAADAPLPADIAQRYARLTLAEGKNERLNLALSAYAEAEAPQEIQDQLRWLHLNLTDNKEEQAAEWLHWADRLDTPVNQQAGVPSVFRTMERRYGRAVALQPDFATAHYHWAIALAEWAKHKHGEAATSLFQQASERFTAAHALAPGNADLLNHWGAAYLAWAKQKQGQMADPFYQKAVEKFADALHLAPNSIPILSNWSSALSNWARQKQGSEADRLFQQAGEKYGQIIALHPQNATALNNWGVALINWAKQKQGTQAEQFYQQAAAKFAQAIFLLPTNANLHFNRACLAGLQGNAADAVYSLSRWKDTAPETTRAKLDQEGDFDRVRDSAEFRAFRDALAG